MRTEGERQFEDEGDDLDPEHVRQGREEDTKYMVKSMEGVFELGPREGRMGCRRRRARSQPRRCGSMN